MVSEVLHEIETPVIKLGDNFPTSPEQLQA